MITRSEEKKGPVGTFIETEEEARIAFLVEHLVEGRVRAQSVPTQLIGAPLVVLNQVEKAAFIPGPYHAAGGAFMHHRLAPTAKGAIAQLIVLRAAAIDGVSQKIAPGRGLKGPEGEGRRPLR